MFAYARRLFKGQPMRVPRVATAALLGALALALGACGDDEGDAAPELRHPADVAEADPEDVRVIENWSRALTSGDTDAAARFFAHPSTAQNGPVLVRIFDQADAVAFNESLPCGSHIISARSEGDFTSVTFRLEHRPGARCGSGTGQTASASFQIARGKIVEWRRTDDLPPAGVGGAANEQAV